MTAADVSQLLDATPCVIENTAIPRCTATWAKHPECVLAVLADNGLVIVKQAESVKADDVFRLGCQRNWPDEDAEPHDCVVLPAHGRLMHPDCAMTNTIGLLRRSENPL